MEKKQILAFRDSYMLIEIKHVTFLAAFVPFVDRTCPMNTQNNTEPPYHAKIRKNQTCSCCHSHDPCIVS
jgi:hypothetical protein